VRAEISGRLRERYAREAGTEVVEFSPSGDYQKTMEVVGRNPAAMQAP
jgi:hypothetical protein